jgi:hypothetical protein
LIWRILFGEGNASFMTQKPYQEYFCPKQQGRNLSYSSLLPVDVFYIMKNMLKNPLTNLQLAQVYHAFYGIEDVLLLRASGDSLILLDIVRILGTLPNIPRSSRYMLARILLQV